MNDRVVGLLDHYNIEVLRTRKGRGALLCDTSQGCLIFKEYIGNTEKILLQDTLLKKLLSNTDFPVEEILRTKDDTLFTEDVDGKKYVLKTYFEGRECNIHDAEECKEAVMTLADLHLKMQLTKEETEQFALSPFQIGKEYEKHNRELRKVWRYLRKKGQKSPFETALLKEYDYFMKQAQEISEEWQDFMLQDDLQYIMEEGMMCHGDYQYHNILRTEQTFAITNFERCIMDNPVRDLCLFMRKLMEKSNWSQKLGKELLNAYNSVRPLSARSFVELYYRLAYPEKFWKIVNFYYNSRKAWIPDRNWEKLKLLSEQEREKQAFLDEIFRTVS